MSSGYPGWTKPDQYYDPDAPPWIEDAGESGRRWLTVLSYLGVAVVAAGIAVALTLVLHGSPHTAGAASPGGSTAAPGGGTQQEMLMVAGTVSKISRTSITIDGPSGAMTAAITDATRITGKIKVGDSVSAQITVTNGQSVAGAIQDPAQVP